VSRELTLLEKLLMLIPGYHGYKQKELIREDDKLVRERAATELDEARILIEKIMPSFSGDWATLEKLDSLRKDLEFLAQKIRHASLGYSGYFDRVKVREDELRKLLEYDYQLVTLSKELRETIEKMASLIRERGRFLAETANAEAKIAELSLVIERRNKVLLGGV